MRTEHLAKALAVVAAVILLPGVPLRADDVAERYAAGRTPQGITFHHRRDPATPFAAIGFGMRDLYAITTPGKDALVSLGGTLVMRGTDGAGQSELMESLKDLAAGASLTIGPFTTVGSVRAPAVTLAPAMAMVAEALRSARPSERLLERLRQRAAGAEAQAALRAETIAHQAAMRLALGDHPLTRGFDPARFDRLAVDDIEQWRRQSLYRDRIRIATSGRLTAAEAGPIIDQAFAGLPTAPASPAFKWPRIDLPATTIVVEHDTAQSAVVMLGLTSIRPGRDLEIATLANAVLGASSSSRLWHAVRAGLGSTYGASSGYQLVGPGTRVIAMRGAIANNQVKASVEALRGAYAAWRKDGITTAELKATSTRLQTDFRSSLDDPTRANAIVVAMQLAGRPVADIYGYADRIAALDLATVNRFILDKLPAPEQLLVVIVTPKADGLDAACVVRSAEEVARCRS